MNNITIELNEKDVKKLTATIEATRLTAMDESTHCSLSIDERLKALDVAIEIAELEKHILDQILAQLDENKPKSQKKSIKVQFE